MKEHNALRSEDYKELLKAYKGKVLAITGKADIQADYRVLEELAQIEGITVYTPEKVNHILREVDVETNIMNVKNEYKKAFKKPISPKIKEWAKFIEEKPAKKAEQPNQNNVEINKKNQNKTNEKEDIER